MLKLLKYNCLVLIDSWKVEDHNYLQPIKGPDIREINSLKRKQISYNCGTMKWVHLNPIFDQPLKDWNICATVRQSREKGSPFIVVLRCLLMLCRVQDVDSSFADSFPGLFLVWNSWKFGMSWLLQVSGWMWMLKHISESKSKTYYWKCMSG